MSLFPALPDDFSRRQQIIIRRAFREACGMLGAANRDGVDKIVADTIVGAARCGCVKHGELVAVALATARGAAIRLQSEDARTMLPGSTRKAAPAVA